MAVSLNPKDAVEGGLLSDIDATLVSLRFGNYIYDFAKNNDESSPNGAESVGLIGKFKTPGGDEFRSIASLGNANEWIIQDAAGSPCQPDAHGYIRDGVKVDSAKGDKTGLSKSSNAYAFFVEMEAAGFPSNKFSDVCTVFDNTFAHWVQKVQKKREGLANQSEREKTVLVAQKILAHGLPWEAAKRKTGAGSGSGSTSGTASKPADNAAAASTTSASTANATTTTTIETDMENTVALEIAIEGVNALRAGPKGGTTIKKMSWGTAKLGALGNIEAFKQLAANDATRAAAARILGNAEWLAENGVMLDSKGDAKVEKPEA